MKDLYLILVFFLSLPCLINGQPNIKEGQAYHPYCLEELFSIDELPISDTVLFEGNNESNNYYFYYSELKDDTQWDKDTSRLYENGVLIDVDPDLDYVAGDYIFHTKYGLIKNNELIVVTLSNGMTRSKLGCKESNYSCSEEILIPNGLAIEVGEDDYMLEECLSNIWEIEGYKNGIPNGKYKEWGLNNKGTYYLSCKGRYNEGIKYGTWEYYDKDGKVTHKKSH